MRGVNVRDLLSSDIPHVQVPDVESPMSDSALRTLRDNIDPLSGDDGKEIYRRVVQLGWKKLDDLIIIYPYIIPSRYKLVLYTNRMKHIV